MLTSVNSMRPVVTDRVAWSVSLSVGLSVSHTIVSPAKTTEPIELPFGLRTQVGPVTWVPDPFSMGRGNFGRETDEPL